MVRRRRRHLGQLKRRRATLPRRRGRRGAADQAEHLDALAILLREVAAFVLWASWLFLTQEDCADVLGIDPRRLRRWLKNRRERRRPRPRGRPVEDLSKELRVGMIAILAEVGPDISLRGFQRCLPPDIPVRDAERFLERYRQAYTWKKKDSLVYALRWHHPGAVWAMDHSKPDAPLERPFRLLFHVRDLGSNLVLTAQPSRGETAMEVIATLKRLFAQHGAPLLIKSDNGSAFKSQEVADFLAYHRVIQLFSPPGTPAYNGGVEAGNGGIKTRTHHEAAKRGHPEYWTCDDVEAGRLHGNELGASPFGLKVPPDVAWNRRTPITDADRDAFAAELTRQLATALDESDHDVMPENFYARKALERQAIMATLTHCDYLSIRRRRISGMIKGRK